MKGKLTKLMMVAMMLVTVFGLAASLATVSTTTTVSAAMNDWSRKDLPTTLKYQMFPDSDIWDLTAAADGTLFAIVEDTTYIDAAENMRIADGGEMNWGGSRWAVFPAYSDVALFKSTDGGCTWTLCWHQPSNDINAPVAVVPQPGYNDDDPNKDEVFYATGSRYIAAAGPAWAGRAGGSTGASGGEIYRSTNGCNSFTKVTPGCPGVIETDYGTITSIDVCESACCGTGCPVPYMVIVGVAGIDDVDGWTNGEGEGVWVWNEFGNSLWQDKMVANDLPPAPMTGTLAAGNGLHVLSVKASPNFTTDHGMMAVLVDYEGILGGAVGQVYWCIYDADDGYWGGDVDSVTNCAIMDGADPVTTANFACQAVGDDYSKTSAKVYVGLDGTNDVDYDDVWLIKGLATVTGPSTSKDLNCNLEDSANFRVSDVIVDGNANDAVYVGCNFPEDSFQAQVMKGTNCTVWAAWTPSFKPPSGASPVYLIDGQGAPMAAGGIDDLYDESAGLTDTGPTTSGVSKCVVSTSRGHVYNGIGLMDDIAVSDQIQGTYAAENSAETGSWWLAQALNEETSPTYDSDGLIYVTTWSEWTQALSLWRLTNGCWERVMVEELVLPDGHQFEGKQMLTNSAFMFETTATAAIFGGPYVEDWWVQVTPTFSTDPYVFVLGAIADFSADDPDDDFVPGAITEMFWYSPDKGDTWMTIPQMPLGAEQTGEGLSDTGWYVQDNKTIFAGDIAGWVYKTTDRGGSWSEGAMTAWGHEVTWIKTSPIYSDSGAAGTDKCLLIGTFDWIPNTITAAALEAAPGIVPMYISEVWLSQDGAVADMNIVCAEVNTDPTAWALMQFGYPPSPDGVGIGGPVADFDINWASNHIIYAVASGWLDEWTLVNTAATSLTRTDFTDVGVYRTVVDFNDPSASTWHLLWGADEWMAETRNPQTLAGMDTIGMMAPMDSIDRFVVCSGLEIGADGTVYVPFAIYDPTYNYNGVYPAFGPGDAPSPHLFLPFGRWTNGGVLRCLDATQSDSEFELVRMGLGEWDGLWLLDAVPGSTHLISLSFDWKEWRFKLACFEDTFSGSGPVASGPADGATGVGALMADTSVSAPVSWQAQTGATLYQWQVSEDAAFTDPQEGTSSGTSVTVPGLKAGTTYFWRTRSIEPMVGTWSTVQEFTTVPGGDTGAPKAGKPEDGSTIVDTTPLFTWEKIASATNYELQVATDPGFGAADIVVDEANLGDVSAYEADKELVNGTYYWRVRGTNPATDTESPWSFGSFTLDTEAEGTGTPVWVWVLIIVGIVLAIIVLVLILRTRRPV